MVGGVGAEADDGAALPGTDWRGGPSRRYRHPYARLLVVRCEGGLDEYRAVVRPALQAAVEAGGSHARRAPPEGQPFAASCRDTVVLLHGPEADARGVRALHEKLCVDFNPKKRNMLPGTFNCPFLGDVCRVCPADEASLIGLDRSLIQSVREAFDARSNAYQEVVRKLSILRLKRDPSWSFNAFFATKESQALLYETVRLDDDALREYYELEVAYHEELKGAGADFGGNECGDDQAALLGSGTKDVRRLCEKNIQVGEFDMLQYIFSRQAAILLKMSQPEVAVMKGIAFVHAFSKRLAANAGRLPAAMSDKWIFSACLALAEVSCEGKEEGLDGTGIPTSPRGGTDSVRTRLLDVSKRSMESLRAELYTHARSKLVSLGEAKRWGPAELSPLPTLRKAPSLLSPVSLDPATSGSDGEASGGGSPGLSRVGSGANAGSASRAASRLAAGDGGAAGGAEAPAAGHSRGPSEVSIGSAVADVGEAGTTSASGENGHGTPLPGVRGDEDVGNGKLREALRSQHGFELLFKELTEQAAANYRKANRPRHAMQLEKDLIPVRLKHGDAAGAFQMLTELCRRYWKEGWTQLLAQTLPELLRVLDSDGLAGAAGAPDAFAKINAIVKLLALDGADGEFSKPRLQDMLVAALAEAPHAGPSGPAVEATGLLAVDRLVGEAGPHRAVIHENDAVTMTVVLESNFPHSIALDRIALVLGDSRGEVGPPERAGFDAISPPTSLADRGGEAEQGRAITLEGADGAVELAPGQGEVRFVAKPHLIGLFKPRALEVVIGGVAFHLGLGARDGCRTLAIDVLPEIQRFDLETALETPQGLVAGWTQLLGIYVQPRDAKHGDASMQLQVGDPANDVAFSGQALVYKVGREARGGEPQRRPMEAGPGGSVALPAWQDDEPRLIVFPVAVAKYRPEARRVGPNVVAGGWAEGRSASIAVELSYVSKVERQVTAELHVPIVEPFAVECNCKAVGQNEIIVQFAARSNLARPVELLKADVQFGGSVAIKRALHAESGILPTTVQPSSQVSFVYYLTLPDDCPPELAGNFLTLQLKEGAEPEHTLHLAGGPPCLVRRDSLGAPPGPGEAAEHAYSFPFTLDVLRFTVSLGLAPNAGPKEFVMGMPIKVSWVVTYIGPEKGPARVHRVQYSMDGAQCRDRGWLISGQCSGTLSLTKGETETITVCLIPVECGQRLAPLPTFTDERHVLVFPDARQSVTVLPPTIQETWMTAVDSAAGA